MSTRNIRLPDIGEGVTEAEILEWQVAVGDAVQEDQILGAVMTDKAAVDIPSPVAGVIASLGGEVGDVLAVGAELARIDVGDLGKSVDNTRDSVDRDSGSHVTENKVSEKNKESTYSEAAVASVDDTDAVRLEGDQRQKVLAAPAVRQRARERAVDLHNLQGSGADGRITHADLDDYLFDAKVSATPPVNQVDSVDEVRVIGLRRQIARQMELASRRIPHFSYIEELDVTELESLRHALAETHNGNNTRLTPLVFIIMAVVRSLDEFPQINACYDDEAGIVRRYSGRHVGIATQTANGLMVPVVRHAESLGIHALAAEIARLASATRDGRISREELKGGTITVTSLGALGGLASTPIINHPEVAIVGVNRIVTRIVCHEEQIVKRRIMNLSSSFDHRIVDGYDAARFIQRVRAYVECPATLFVRD